MKYQLRKKLIRGFLISVIYLPGSLVFSAERDENKTNTEELARVAIFNFEDKTGTQDFQYMSSSLSDAVNSSMLKNFTYERIDIADIESSLQKAREKTANTQSKKSDKKPGHEDEFFNILKFVAKDLKADIIIYGSYIFDEKSQNLVIQTGLFYAASQEQADLPEVSNKVDNTIFNVTAKTANNIIGEIQKMASQAIATANTAVEESLATSDGDESAAAAKDGDIKIVLTRKLASSFSRYVDYYDGTIVDNKTGLIWQKCQLTSTGKSRCSRVISANWQKSTEYCENLDLAGRQWSLPYREELESLVYTRAKRPAINILFAPFTDGYIKPYWSLSEHDTETHAWAVDFAEGLVKGRKKSDSANIRCVCRDKNLKSGGGKKSTMILPIEPTWGSMLALTFLAPGAGHIQAGQWRGWVYLTLWAGATGTFVYSLINYDTAYNNYYNAFNSLESAYAEYNDALIFRNYAFLPFLGVYAISLLDIIITGNLYTKPATETLSFHLMAVPEITGNRQEEINYQFQIQRRF